MSVPATRFSVGQGRKATLCMVAGLMLAGSLTHAQLTLSAISGPNWGSITRPSTGTARYTLNYSTGAVTLSSGSGYAFDNGAAGLFRVAGLPGPISFSVSIGPFSGVGLTVISAHINGASSVGTGILTGAGPFSLKIG